MFDVLKRIKELREARGWSVYRLAKLSNIPQSTIATWYQKNLYPPIDKIEQLCDTFEISLADFFIVADIAETSHINEKTFQNLALLSPEQRKIIMDLIEVFLNHKS